MDVAFDPSRALIVTAADSRYFFLLEGLVRSMQDHRPSSDWKIGCFDLGLTDDNIAWLQDRDIEVVVPTTGLRHGITEGLQGKLGYLARPFMREAFPGYEAYLWFDSDTWIQTWDVVDRLIAGVIKDGAAVVTEDAPDYYFRPDLLGWKAINFRRGYGIWTGMRLFFKPHINSGVFALSAGAPHWERWQKHYQDAIDRSGRYAPFDQFGLNAAIYLDRLPATFLPPTCNWICELGPPLWNDETILFCRPHRKDEPISVMHLAGLAKTQPIVCATTSGSKISRILLYSPPTPRHDH